MWSNLWGKWYIYCGRLLSPKSKNLPSPCLSSLSVSDLSAHISSFRSSLSENKLNISRRIMPSSITRALMGESLKIRHFCTKLSRKLEGKVALITGAGNGIGRETAIKFIENGAKIVIADIDHEQGKAVATQLGRNASFIGCDVSDESAISSAVDHAVSHFGRLDIMFNNAGIACHTPPSIVDLDLANYDRTMAINVRGVVAGIKHASRVMIPQRSGSILCTSSIAGISGGLAQHTYSISKFSVVGIVKSLTAELCHHGIRINCISPFAIPTRFVLEEISGYYHGVDPERLTDMIRKTGQLEGACCEPSDIANAALFLASDEAKYISGHNLVVDGGFTSTKSLQLPTPDQMKANN